MELTDLFLFVFYVFSYNLSPTLNTALKRIDKLREQLLL